MFKHSFKLVFIFLSVFVYGQDSTQFDLNYFYRTNLKLSNRKIPYSDSLTSKLYTFFGEPMNGPQFFLILKQDSLFTWDSWYGHDSFISSGKYTIIGDTLIITGDSFNTNLFEKEYNKAKPEWTYYKKIEVKKKFLIIKGVENEEIKILALLNKNSTYQNRSNEFLIAYVNALDKYFLNNDLKSLKQLITKMEEKKIDPEVIDYAKMKIQILESKNE
jgi:hypothetical protein